MMSSNIKVIDFSDNKDPTKFDVEEHIKFDDSQDYLSISKDVIPRIIFHFEENNEGTALVRIGDIDNLINALLYLKGKYNDQY